MQDKEKLRKQKSFDEAVKDAFEKQGGKMYNKILDAYKEAYKEIYLQKGSKTEQKYLEIVRDKFADKLGLTKNSALENVRETLKTIEKTNPKLAKKVFRYVQLEMLRDVNLDGNTKYTKDQNGNAQKKVKTEYKDIYTVTDEARKVKIAKGREITKNFLKNGAVGLVLKDVMKVPINKQLEAINKQLPGKLNLQVKEIAVKNPNETKSVKTYSRTNYEKINQKDRELHQKWKNPLYDEIRDITEKASSITPTEQREMLEALMPKGAKVYSAYQNGSKDSRNPNKNLIVDGKGNVGGMTESVDRAIQKLSNLKLEKLYGVYTQLYNSKTTVGANLRRSAIQPMINAEHWMTALVTNKDNIEKLYHDKAPRSSTVKLGAASKHLLEALYSAQGVQKQI